MKLQGQTPHPLLGLVGKFDVDPGRYRPMYYGLDISVPVLQGGVGQGSVTLNNQPYIMTRIMHKVTGRTATPTTSGLYQDGQYYLEFKDEQSNYQNQPIPADIMFGSVETGFVVELPYPIAFAGNKTLTFRITNVPPRALSPQEDNYTVSIAVHGIADWGTLSPGG